MRRFRYLGGENGNKMIKIIANYLPQFHRIPENDMWWGEGYTDWIAAKNAKPLFDGHQQPRVPLGENYYDLSKVDTIRWQANLAKKYGVYGWGIYHYWFNSELQLLQKPAELLLANKDIDIHFMFLWDNKSWQNKSWVNINFNDTQKVSAEKSGVLARLDYGNEEDWEKHFNYLLPFFKDDRYIKFEGKPMFGFWNMRQDVKTVKKMVSYWNILAQKNGFHGILCMSKDDWRADGLEYRFKVLPNQHRNLFQAIQNKIHFYMKGSGVLKYDYDEWWHKQLDNAIHSDSKTFLSGFIDYDDTARRGECGTVVLGSTPEKFGKYFTELLKISKKQGKEYVFCPAWNEWGEGHYLEPDTLNGYGYLEALKAAVDEVNGTK